MKMSEPNQTHDINGREWAKLSELRAGDTVELDGGFDCHTAGVTILHEDSQGLFFGCGEGTHRIDGQADNGEHCVGIYGPIREGV